MLLLRPPGVYRPQADTDLLADALATAGIPYGARVLDVGTGTGALAVAAARAGAGKVTAIDISWRAALAAWFNTWARRLPVQVQRGDLLTPVTGREYDVILANPPYVPSQRISPARHRRSRAWDAGPHGRAQLDRLCVDAPSLLAPGGMLLLVQSAVCGVDSTLRQLRRAGLTASVMARHLEPFGPVMRRRREYLQSSGMIQPHQQHEELVVIRAEQPVPAAPAERGAVGTAVREPDRSPRRAPVTRVMPSISAPDHPPLRRLQATE